MSTELQIPPLDRPVVQQCQGSVIYCCSTLLSLTTISAFQVHPEVAESMQMRHYHQIVEKVDRRLNWELERPDIMSHVIEARKGTTGLPIGVIHATFMTLTTAGSKTTATVLSGATNYLANNPDKLEALAIEVRQRFQSEEDISLDALRHLPYLNAVIKEALRLCPPVPWMLPRLVPASGG